MGLSEDVAHTEEEAPSWAESFRIIWQVRTLRRMYIALPFVAIAIVGLLTLGGLYYEEVFDLDERGRGFLSAGVEGAADDGHPGTHDLLLDALAALDAVVEEVRITDVDEGIWTAEVVVNRMTIAARVSDAVALALRSGAPILASAEVLDAAGVGGAVAAGATDLVFGADVQMERFRAFLDTISPDDFAPEDPTDPGGPG